jgi:hypothetical protein
MTRRMSDRQLDTVASDGERRRPSSVHQEVPYQRGRDQESEQEP